MHEPTLILASSSPRRRELLGELGVTFRVIKPEIDETQHKGESPAAYVQRLSREKAQAVRRTLDAGAAVLAADTVVIETSGEILGKPADADEARDMLLRLRGQVHRVCTAFTLLSESSAITRIVCTEVHMRDYADNEISAYIATGDPFDKAGGYAIQHEGFSPVARIEGSYTNVVGLPVEAVKEALAEAGLLPV